LFISNNKLKTIPQYLLNSLGKISCHNNPLQISEKHLKKQYTNLRFY
jgi:hypothetical protein